MLVSDLGIPYEFGKIYAQDIVGYCVPLIFTTVFAVIVPIAIVFNPYVTEYNEIAKIIMVLLIFTCIFLNILLSRTTRKIFLKRSKLLGKEKLIEYFWIILRLFVVPVPVTTAFALQMLGIGDCIPLVVIAIYVAAMIVVIVMDFSKLLVYEKEMYSVATIGDEDYLVVMRYEGVKWALVKCVVDYKVKTIEYIRSEFVVREIECL